MLGSTDDSRVPCHADGIRSGSEHGFTDPDRPTDGDRLMDRPGGTRLELPRQHRYEWVDAMRGLSALFIVWHHLTLYAPQSDLADRVAPDLMFFLYNRALYAVQIFFVIGGFSMALTQSRSFLSPIAAGQRFFHRYLRLAIPYVAMLAVFLSVCGVSAAMGVHLGLLDRFSWSQLVAHLFFLQDLTGHGSFSAGTWYLCITIQFVALYYLVLSACYMSFGAGTERVPATMSAVLCPLGIAAAWVWNRDTRLEVTVFYFLTPLVLGALIAWTVERRLRTWVCVAFCVAVASSLVVHFRPQLMVALGGGILLWIGLARFPNWRNPSWLRWLSEISYSLFLVHYGVNGVVLVVLDRWARTGPHAAYLSMLIAFGCSLLVAQAFYVRVELPVLNWLKTRSAKTAATSVG
jgi:peptidoglycan/LPS O-acetylase OafA/YrhL